MSERVRMEMTSHQVCATRDDGPADSGEHHESEGLRAERVELRQALRNALREPSPEGVSGRRDLFGTGTRVPDARVAMPAVTGRLQQVFGHHGMLGVGSAMGAKVGDVWSIAHLEGRIEWVGAHRARVAFPGTSPEELRQVASTGALMHAGTARESVPETRGKVGGATMNAVGRERAAVHRSVAESRDLTTGRCQGLSGNAVFINRGSRMGVKRGDAWSLGHLQGVVEDVFTYRAKVLFKDASAEAVKCAYAKGPRVHAGAPRHSAPSCAADVPTNDGNALKPRIAVEVGVPVLHRIPGRHGPETREIWRVELPFTFSVAGGRTQREWFTYVGAINDFVMFMAVMEHLLNICDHVPALATLDEEVLKPHALKLMRALTAAR
jgi:hypothetical protein